MRRSERLLFWPGQEWSHLRILLGDSSSEGCCCSLQQQFQLSAMAPMPPATRVTPDPRALACLKATAYSVLLPRRRATYTLLMVPYGASGAPVGVRRTMRGA